MNAKLFTISAIVASGMLITGCAKDNGAQVENTPPTSSTPVAETKGTTVNDNVAKTNEEWRKKLTPEQYAVTCEGGTERAFTGKYWNHHEDGKYMCVRCGEPLFDSTTKYDSGSGWPSYHSPDAPNAVDTKSDVSHGMVRTEVVCKKCGAHLGHVFPDGPKPTGKRYCINSASLNFQKRKSKSKGEPPAELKQ